MINFDEEFVNKLIQQDHSTFNSFYLKTVDIFFRYIKINYFLSKEDAEDIISDFYVKFWDAVTKYDDKKSFVAYVWTIFKNNLIDYFKKSNETSFSLLDNTYNEDSESFADQLEDDFDLVDLIDKEFQFEKIEMVMQKIDVQSREIIYFKFIDDRSYEEIADILNINQENVRQRISRAIKLLKSLLKGYNSN